MRRASRPTSLRLRLALWSSASIALVSILLSITYHARMQELVTREADARTRILGEHLAAQAELGVLAASAELLGPLVEGSFKNPDLVSLAIYDPGGKLLASRARSGTGPPPLAAVNLRCAPCAEGSELLRWVVPVTRQGAAEGFFRGDQELPALETAGYVLMELSTATRRREARALLVRGVAVSLSVLLLGVLVSLVVAQRLTAPLRTMAGAARQIGQGDWVVTLPERAPRELAELADDFRSMAVALQRLDQENRGYRENLEAMVTLRTGELEQAYERMKELNRAKDDFVATVSHDFRSPLAIILSMVQTIRADPAMPGETIHRFLGRVERQCKRLQALVGDLLDLARIENRPAELEQLSLYELVAEQVEASQPAFAARGLTLTLQGEQDTSVPAERSLLERALGNLLDNARKFTPPPGRVEVRVYRRGGAGVITVTDTGLGIAEVELPRICEPFFQSERDAPKGEGSGLGLAIVAEVMRKHGGRVEVTSKLGEGTTFELVMPQGD
jgi:signal transduction histidine kinase